MKLPAFLVSIPLLVICGCHLYNHLDETQLKHHNFKLQTIDNKMVSKLANAHIQFIDAMSVNGFTGCNRFFGQGILNDDKLKIDKLGMSRKSCEPEMNKIEAAMIDTLSDWSDITLKEGTLSVIGKNHLVFQLVPSTY